jgi:SAM-dependent methyltransferase
MPEYYNRAIDLCQYLALRKWLARCAKATVLDVGCGVGRWSRRLAYRGARVTGVDVSPTMVAEAERRTALAGLSARCRFRVGDITRLDVGGMFSVVVCVTLLQHVLGREAFGRAVQGLQRHLAPGGRLLVLEVAPSRPYPHCDSGVFTARTVGEYDQAFRAAGLHCLSVGGVDPSTLRVLFLPHYRRLPAGVRSAALGAITGISLPIDLLLGRLWVRASWHKLFVLAREMKA